MLQMTKPSIVAIFVYLLISAVSSVYLVRLFFSLEDLPGENYILCALEIIWLPSSTLVSLFC